MSQTQTAATAPAADIPQVAFVRMAAVVRMTGLGRSTIYRLISENKFPSPVRLAKRAVAWRRIDLETWSAERPTVSHWT
jgi:prophage regulatory protein